MKGNIPPRSKSSVAVSPGLQGGEDEPVVAPDELDEVALFGVGEFVGGIADYVVRRLWFKARDGSHHELVYLVSSIN